MLNDFVAAENITSSIGEGLAVLLSHESSELLSVLLEEGLVLEHHTNSCRGGYMLPSLESLLCVGDGGVELILSGHGDLSDDILGQRALDVEALSGSRLDPFAVDVVFVDFAEVASSC